MEIFNGKVAEIGNVQTLICLVLCGCAAVFASYSARGGTSDGSEEWGYIPVRPGASMFYWFYRTTHPDGYKNRPIVLWLQGGPGLSGTGLGNFLMFGPVDQYLKPRNTTWIQTTNILFVDSPVHSGFSVAHNTSCIPETIKEISDDLITVLKIFFREHSYFERNPFYIFGQSYGGKMAAALAYYLNKAVNKGQIACNLKGIGIGNGYVSPVDSILSYSTILYQLGLIDHTQYSTLNSIASDALEEPRMRNWENARKFMDDFWVESDSYVPGMSPYNFLDFGQKDTVYDTSIEDFMNRKIREKLGIVPTDKQWGEDIYKVYFNQNDLLAPVWNLVDELLKTTELDIVVYQGQFDFICSTTGTIAWMQKLTWPGLTSYNEAKRNTLVNSVTQIPEMFVKSHGHLKMYWIMNAGHAVPFDVSHVALRMLNRILDDVD